MRQSSHTTSLINLFLILLALPLAGSSSAIYSPPGSSSPPEQQQTTRTGMVVARIYYNRPADLGLLSSQLDVWETRPQDGYLVARIAPEEVTQLIQSGYRVEIDPLKTALLSQGLKSLAGQVNGIPGYPCYRTVEETYATLSLLASAHPDLASWVDIGDSWDKLSPGGPDGYDLFTLVLTNHAVPGPKPVFFLMAAIHARELVTAETAARFAEFLVDQYGLDPDVTWLLDHFEIHILPIANPDGHKWAEQGEYWRKNTDQANGCNTFPSYGTDLNRNHSFHWNEGGTSDISCSETYHGATGASEPEVQAIQDYLAALFPDQRGPGDEDPAPMNATGILISLHSYSELVLWPYGFRNQPAPNSQQLQTLGRKFAYYNHYKPEQAVGLYPASGTSDDWAYGQLGVAAYTFEMGTSFFQDCQSFENTVYPDNLQALIYAFKSARLPYQNPAGPDSLGLAAQPPAVVSGSSVVLSGKADDTRYTGGEPVQNIAAARYTVDAPSWQASISAHPLVAVDGHFDSPVEGVRASIDTTAWLPGHHLLFVESQDSAGDWGVPSAAFLCVAKDSHAVGTEPGSITAQAPPGKSATYSIHVTNQGAITETFDVNLSGNRWVTQAPLEVGPLGPCMSADIKVTVSVPVTATIDETDQVTVKFTSRGDAGKSGVSTLTTRASRVYSLAVAPLSGVSMEKPGEVITTTLQLANTGNITDTYKLSLAGNSWDTFVSISPPVTLGPGAQISFTVAVHIPESASIGDNDRATLTIASQGDKNRQVLVMLTTYAGWQEFLPLQSKAQQE